MSVTLHYKCVDEGVDSNVNLFFVEFCAKRAGKSTICILSSQQWPGYDYTMLDSSFLNLYFLSTFSKIWNLFLPFSESIVQILSINT